MPTGTGALTGAVVWVATPPAPAGCALQLACVDQNESYVSAWFCAPNMLAEGECEPVAGMLIGNGELETYAFERYWCGEYDVHEYVGGCGPGGGGGIFCVC